MKHYFPNGQFRPNCMNKYCTNPVQERHQTKSGHYSYKPFCTSCINAAKGKQAYKSRVQPIKKTYCENRDGRLGFKCTATDLNSHQLDLDHIDGNHENNHHTNGQTICSNCHREKSHREKDCHPTKYRNA